MANVPVTFAPGERLAHLGVLVTASSAARFAGGLDVSIRGSALERGLVQLTRVRARPWSARLAPWQACGWEHALAARGEALHARLRAAVPPPTNGEPGSPRQLLALALWIEVEGVALAVGDGVLAIEVAPACEPAAITCEEHAVRVEAAPPPVSLSLYVAWEGSLSARADEIRPLLDDLARGAASIEAAPRALAARGTARRAVYLRPGCVVLAPSGLAGDARFEALWLLVQTGGVERVQFIAPSRSTMDLVVAQSPRVRDAPVEMVVSFDVHAIGIARSAAASLLVDLLASAACVAGFVAEHPFVPSLRAQTPWERGRGGEPARTIEALRMRPRVDARDALAVRGPS